MEDDILFMDEIEEEPERPRRRWMIPLIIAGALLLAVLLFFGLFYITDVEVVGNTQFTDADIERLTMDGFLRHNSLYLAKLKKTIVMDEEPFIEAVDIEYLDRNSVRLHVSENLAIGRIEQDGMYYYFDVSGIILNTEPVEPEGLDADANDNPAEALSAELVPRDERDQTGSDTEFHPALTEYVPVITGLTDTPVKEGEKVDAADEGIFQTIHSLTKLLDRFEMEPDRLDLDIAYDMTLYFGEARIALGGDAYLEEKVSRAAAILPQIEEEGLVGVLHLENYTPGQQNIVFTEGAAEGSAQEGEAAVE